MDLLTFRRGQQALDFALFENINSLTVTHTNTNVFDGFDLALHAFAVPEPGSLVLAGPGLMGLAATRRRSR